MIFFKKVITAILIISAGTLYSGRTQFDYFKQGYGTIFDLEDLLLLKLGVDPRSKNIHAHKPRIYAQIYTIFNTLHGQFNVAVPYRGTYYRGKILTTTVGTLDHDIESQLHAYTGEIAITLLALVPTECGVPIEKKVNEFFSAAEICSCNVLYDICGLVNTGQIFVEGNQVTRDDLLAYAELVKINLGQN